jgi:ligand-binding sensor domain-containing protein
MGSWRAGKIPFLFIAILLFTGSNTAFGQEYSYARYDVKDGLAGSVVYHGVEDHDGFLWFATETGVSRFDGTHFRNFTRADGLPDNEITKLFVDSKGRVWMMPFRNAICYYWKGKIYNQENDSLLKRLTVDSHISDMVEDRQGNLLLADNRRIIFITTNQQIHLVAKLDEGMFMAGCAGLNPGGNFTVFLISSANEAYMVNYAPDGTVTRKELLDYRPIYRNFISPTVQIFYKADSLQFTTNGGRTKLTIEAPSNFTQPSVINDTIFSINTGNGSFLYETKKGGLVRHVLQGMTVNTVFQDREGNHWFLTAGAGIFRIGSYEFTNYTFSQNGTGNLGIYAVTKFDSLLYAGSEKSFLFTIDLTRKQVKPHQLFKGGFNTRIMSFLQPPGKPILLGTNKGVYTQQGKEWGKTLGQAVKSMQLDEEGVLISMQSGLLKIPNEHGYSDFWMNLRSTCSYKQGKVYFNGTLNGLYSRDSLGKDTWLGEKEPLLRGRIMDLEGAADGMMWIATHGDGVIGYKNGKIVHSIRQKDGLTSDICRTIFVAGKDVWVGTDRGLNRLQWHQGAYQITTFNSADGLIADIIYAIHVDGAQVSIGTPAGLTTFDADKISLHSFCRLRITSIQAAGSKWALDTTGFTLPPSNNAIRFDYVGISYRSAGDIIYRYRLVGLDESWQSTRETFLNYLSLPSGNYELQVQATNKFGVSSNIISIPFQVEKLLWEKAWFRILALIIAWILIWIFVNTRIKRVRRLNDEKLQVNNRMADLEQMALKAQMNPHFIFNSLNSVQQYVIDKDLLGANKFITEFSRLIRLTLDISSKNRISIYEEISYLTTYLELEKTKFEDKFTYSIALVGELDPSDWYIPPMILQPYVENSIRHGVRYRRDNKGHIKISFQLSEQYLVCQVEDNGVGRKKAGQYKSEMPIEYQSKGMTLTARRIEMLNKNKETPVLIAIEDLETNNQPAGTRVTLQFPLQDASRNS